MQTTLGQNAKRFVKQPKNLFSLLCFCVAGAFAAQTSCVVMEGDGLLICDTRACFHPLCHGNFTRPIFWREF